LPPACSAPHAGVTAPDPNGAIFQANLLAAFLLARLAAAVWWANASDERALAKMNLVNETVQLKVPESQRT
jgi:hypothetical protein